MSKSQEEENFRFLQDKKEKKELDEISRLLNAQPNLPKAQFSSFGSMNCPTSSARCDCGKEFKSYDFLKMHIKRNGCKPGVTSLPNTPAISKCDICNRSFVSIISLSQHKAKCDPFRYGIYMPETPTKNIAKRNNIKKENSKKFMKSCYAQEVFSQETKKRKPLAPIGNRAKKSKKGPAVVDNYWMM